MKSRAAAPIALAVIVLVLLFLLISRFDEPSRQERSGSDSKGENPTIQRTARDQAEVGSGKNEFAETPAVIETDPSTRAKKLGRDAIANEYVLRFRNAKDKQDFLERARKRGIEILGSLDKFNSVRIRARSREELESLLNDGPRPSEYDNNFWVRVPETGNQDVQLPDGVYTGFGARALAWLGVNGDNREWGKGVVVAVLDTGIEDHATLSGKSITRLDLLGPEATASGNYQGHGTAVASILAGSSAEAPGMAPATDLLSIRVASGDGVGNGFTLAWGIVEAVDRGANVISLSMGSQGDSFILREAVQYALDNGVAIVASTGNDAIEGVAYPARYPGVLAVTAVDAELRHLYFANRGEEVDLAAPGLGVNAAWSGNQVVSFSGTSAAVPFVTGAMATLLSQNSRLTANDASEILLQYSNDLGAPSQDAEFGQGVLDMERVLERDQRGIYDMAVAGVYVDNASGTLWVAAQNRGTERLWSVQLKATIDGASYSYDFYNVNVGQTISQQFHVDSARLREAGGVRVSSSVTIRGVADGRPRNNARSTLVFTRSPMGQ